MLARHETAALGAAGDLLAAAPPVERANIAPHRQTRRSSRRALVKDEYRFSAPARSKGRFRRRVTTMLLSKSMCLLASRVMAKPRLCSAHQAGSTGNELSVVEHLLLAEKRDSLATPGVPRRQSLCCGDALSALQLVTRRHQPSRRPTWSSDSGLVACWSIPAEIAMSRSATCEPKRPGEGRRRRKAVKDEMPRGFGPLVRARVTGLRPS